MQPSWQFWYIPTAGQQEDAFARVDHFEQHGPKPRISQISKRPLLLLAAVALVVTTEHFVHGCLTERDE